MTFVLIVRPFNGFNTKFTRYSTAFCLQLQQVTYKLLICINVVRGGILSNHNFTESSRHTLKNFLLRRHDSCNRQTRTLQCRRHHVICTADKTSAANRLLCPGSVGNIPVKISFRLTVWLSVCGTCDLELQLKSERTKLPRIPLRLTHPDCYVIVLQHLLCLSVELSYRPVLNIKYLFLRDSRPGTQLSGTLPSLATYLH